MKQARVIAEMPKEFYLSNKYYIPLAIPGDDNPVFEHAADSAALKELLPQIIVAVKSLGNKRFFAEDTEERRVLSVIIKRGTPETWVEIAFKFGMSIHDTEILNAPGVFRHHNEKQEIFDTLLYDILACIPSDFSAGQMSFREFCSDFGYDQDSRTAKKIHKRCIKQYVKLSQVFTAQELECFPS